MTFDKEFKEAISRLSSDEKDKLIFRLLKKDLNLANQLLFELTSGDSKEDRRKQAEKRIDSMVAMSKRNLQNASPGILLMYMRDTVGIVNEHVKTTKDKYGEISLLLLVMQEFLQIYNDYFKDFPPKKAYTLNIYLVAKAYKIMILLKKIHENVRMDFAGDLERTGHLFADNSGLMKVAIYNGLDVNWLIRNEIPDNIAEMEKDLRQRGYLK